MTMSNLGLLLASSFIQILMSLVMWGEVPGGTATRKPSNATYKEKQLQFFFCTIKFGGRERQFFHNLWEVQDIKDCEVQDIRGLRSKLQEPLQIASFNIAFRVSLVPISTRQEHKCTTGEGSHRRGAVHIATTERFLVKPTNQAQGTVSHASIAMNGADTKKGGKK